MSEISNETPNKKKSLGRGLGSLLGPNPDLDQKPTTATTSLSNQSPTSVASLTSPALKAGQQPTQASGQVSTQSKSVAPAVAAAPTPAPQPVVPPESRVWQVPVDKLRPSAFQPRSVFEKEKLHELAQSIKTIGILQPITARKLANGSFEIIAGERRWRAAQLAGLHEVPVLLKTLGDRETLEMALIENIQREDLNPIEEAEAYQKLAQEFQLTQQQVSEKVGKERATVANAIRLLQLPLDVRDMISSEEISVGHAKVLLALPSPHEQAKWARKVRDESLTVRKLEKSIQEVLVPPKTEKEDTLKSGVTQRLIAGLSDELQKLLGTKVNIDYSNSKGKISIHFYSDDELTQIVDRMRN